MFENHDGILAPTLSPAEAKIVRSMIGACSRLPRVRLRVGGRRPFKKGCEPMEKDASEGVKRMKRAWYKWNSNQRNNGRPTKTFIDYIWAREEGDIKKGRPKKDDKPTWKQMQPCYERVSAKYDAHGFSVFVGDKKVYHHGNTRDPQLTVGPDDGLPLKEIKKLCINKAFEIARSLNTEVSDIS